MNVKFQLILASISIVGFVVITVLAFLAAKFGQEWATQMMNTILPLLVGCWVTNFTTVVNYFFGSSSGSADKNEAINAIMARIKSS